MSLFEFLVAAAFLIIELLGVFALIDVIRRPSWQWEQARKSKTKWIVLLVLGLFLPGGGLLLALIYFFITQNALKVATPADRAPWRLASLTPPAQTIGAPARIGAGASSTQRVPE